MMLERLMLARLCIERGRKTRPSVCIARSDRQQTKAVLTRSHVPPLLSFHGGMRCPSSSGLDPVRVVCGDFRAIVSVVSAKNEDARAEGQRAVNQTGRSTVIGLSRVGVVRREASQVERHQSRLLVFDVHHLAAVKDPQIGVGDLVLDPACPRARGNDKRASQRLAPNSEPPPAHGWNDSALAHLWQRGAFAT